MFKIIILALLLVPLKSYSQHRTVITVSKANLYLSLRDSSKKTIYYYPKYELIRIYPYNSRWCIVKRYGNTYYLRTSLVHIYESGKRFGNQLLDDKML